MLFGVLVIYHLWLEPKTRTKIDTTLDKAPLAASGNNNMMLPVLLCDCRKLETVRTAGFHVNKINCRTKKQPNESDVCI